MARYAYEFQYLRLSAIADPLDYFLGSTWFGEHFIDRRVVSRSAALDLFELVGALCACFAVDETAFAGGAPA